MQSVQQGVESFLGVVSKCADRAQVVESIKQLRHTKDYKCPSVSTFALHLILDLYSEYSEDSSREANMNHIIVNLEAAANELLQLSERIRSLR